MIYTSKLACVASALAAAALRRASPAGALLAARRPACPPRFLPAALPARCLARAYSSDAGPSQQWNALPRAVRIQIIKEAGVLTQFLDGSLPAAQLDAADKQQMWLEAFEIDWDGDLARLPKVPYLPLQAYWAIHSKAMFDRVAALGWHDSESLQHTALRNGWTDRLDASRPHELCDAAASAGDLDTLRDLVDVRRAASPTEDMAKMAAVFGHLHVLRFLHERMPDGAWSTEVMDYAAWGAKLDCLKFLHESRSEGCSPMAMNKAAERGALQVVQWLHENRPEGCTSDAIDWAAEHGHLDVVKFLHSVCAAPCTTSAIDRAAEHGHLAVVKFLNENRSEGYTVNAINWAEANGHTEVLEYLKAAAPRQ
ncbi:hypothetical protein HK105_208616 [Polyrhizophydium stewartii]|uniref:Ankyrin repeat protein n=1 Tax=Polyrhizophydium stewartii TaxID=2732419 RepID=A0ABR4MXE8_9FUNG|nr:hypothetical protein HK105_003232 [Polyrhizophydium stewartii]